MDDLKGKMQEVENLMHNDEDRQNDLIRMRLEQRRTRRKKLEENLKDVEKVINENEREKNNMQDERLEVI